MAKEGYFSGEDILSETQKIQLWKLFEDLRKTSRRGNEYKDPGSGRNLVPLKGKKIKVMSLVYKEEKQETGSEKSGVDSGKAM